MRRLGRLSIVALCDHRIADRRRFGGALYVSAPSGTTGRSVTLEDVVVGTLAEPNLGGGVFLGPLSHTTLTACTIQYNDGGGLRASSMGELSIADSVFDHNTGGSGVRLEAGSGAATIVRSRFSNNSGASRGGGLEITQGSKAILDDVTFEGNSATLGGGIVVTDGSSSTIQSGGATAPSPVIQQRPAATCSLPTAVLLRLRQ